ncbi:MAG: hypothetical protein IPH69_18140 [Bacteroidales bacterium]|nr:hypothetical protein [Bacteroidales bacterium]
MEKVRLFRISTFLSWSLIVLACLNAAFGIALLIKTLHRTLPEDSIKLYIPYSWFLRHYFP